jgi:hypothetical protein
VYLHWPYVSSILAAPGPAEVKAASLPLLVGRAAASFSFFLVTAGGGEFFRIAGMLA